MDAPAPASASASAPAPAPAPAALKIGQILKKVSSVVSEVTNGLSTEEFLVKKLCPRDLLEAVVGEATVEAVLMVLTILSFTRDALEKGVKHAHPVEWLEHSPASREELESLKVGDHFRGATLLSIADLPHGKVYTFSKKVGSVMVTKVTSHTFEAMKSLIFYERDGTSTVSPCMKSNGVETNQLLVPSDQKKVPHPFHAEQQGGLMTFWLPAFLTGQKGWGASVPEGESLDLLKKPFTLEQLKVLRGFGNHITLRCVPLPTEDQ
jgi:hypothetical protein